MNDALNQPIVFGAKYGYSSSESSRITVVVGKAIKETPAKKITLEVESRRNFLYGEEYDRTWAGNAKVVHVHPCHLFPVKD